MCSEAKAKAQVRDVIEGQRPPRRRARPIRSRPPMEHHLKRLQPCLQREVRAERRRRADFAATAPCHRGAAADSRRPRQVTNYQLVSRD